MNDQELLREAIAEAKAGLREGGLPIGSVLANRDGQVVARGHNLRGKPEIPPLTLRQCASAMPDGGGIGPS